MMKPTKPLLGLDTAKLLLLANAILHQFHANGQTLSRALLEDLFPPRSESCQSPDSFKFEFKPDGDWHDEYKSAEEIQFLLNMKHKEKNPDRNWSMRIGTGGHCYSFRGPFGEVLPDKVSTDSLWNDAVMQQVAVNTEMNSARVGKDNHWYIHQAGPYQRAEGVTEEHPFYSPALGWDCSEDGCSVVGWGQQAHIPMPYRSDILYYTRYSDCGNGVIEITNVIHNAADPDSPDAVKVNWLNTFWGGFKTSVLEDVLLSDEDGQLHFNYPLQTFGINEMIPYVYRTAGYVVFAQDLPIPPNDTLNKFDMPCSSYSSTDCIQLVIKSDDTCVRSKSHTDRYMVRCALEFTAEVDHGCENCYLYFTNPRTGKGFEVPHVAHWAIMGRMIYFNPKDITADDINQIFFKGDVIDVTYSTSFRMPCTDATLGRIKECPINPSAYDQEVVKLTVAEDKSCREIAFHTEKNKRYSVRLKLKPTRACRDGCDGCKLKFINERTKESIGVAHVSHWAFRGKDDYFIYFTPLEEKSDDEINDKFKAGDNIIVENLDLGKPLEENLGISVIYGTEPDILSPEYFRSSRLRFGSTFFSKDFTVFVHNPRIELHPCESFVSRQYLIVDKLDGIQEKSKKWANQSFKEHYACSEFSGRRVDLYTEDDKFGTRLPNETCDDDSTLHCSGKTVPQTGLIAYFYIECEKRTYVGPDKYFFAPKRTDDSQPLEAYFCKDKDNENTTPEWTLLGYFPKKSCPTLKDVEYKDDLCKS